MKFYPMWNPDKAWNNMPPRADVERIAAQLSDLFRLASTLSPAMVAEAVRLDVRNYARECDEELS